MSLELQHVIYTLLTSSCQTLEKKLKPIQIRNDVQQTEHFLDFLERTAETTNKQITFSYYVQH